MRRQLWVCLLLFPFAFLASALHRADADLMLNPVFVDGGGQTWDAITRGVVNQAINDWKSVFSGVDDGAGGSTTVSVNFNVSFSNAGTNSYLGQWQGSTNSSIRSPWSNSTHLILLNADYLNSSLSNKLWFDPTPSDNGSDKAFADWDAVTVMRHEIGHMLGFSSLYQNSLGQNPWTSLIVNNVFDPNGLNVAMQPGDAGHVLDDAFLMDTALSNAEGRIDISSLEAQMLSKAYGYTITAVPEPASLLLVLACGPVGLFAMRRSKKSSNRKSLLAKT